jgi:cytochrome-b5 reductase
MEDSTWLVVNEKVYDITIYKKYHPGGLEKIMMGAGKDATSLICNLWKGK